MTDEERIEVLTRELRIRNFIQLVKNIKLNKIEQTRKLREKMEQERKEIIEIKDIIKSIRNDINIVKAVSNFIKNFYDGKFSLNNIITYNYHLFSEMPYLCEFCIDNRRCILEGFYREIELKKRFDIDYSLYRNNEYILYSYEGYEGIFKQFADVLFESKRTSFSSFNYSYREKIIALNYLVTKEILKKHSSVFEQSVSLKPLSNFSFEEIVYDYCKKVYDVSADCFIAFLLKHDNFFKRAIREFHFDSNSYTFLELYYEIVEYLNKTKNIINSDISKKRLEDMLFSQKNEQRKSYYTIIDVDNLSGEEFEDFVCELFKKFGYQTRQTQTTGDYGVDVIAEKDKEKIAIQTKRYQGSVSLNAVQEVVAGMSYYNCTKGMVITNSDYTSSAINLAKKNNIELWDRQELVFYINSSKIEK